MAAAYYSGDAFSLKFQDFRDPNQNSDATDQWGIAFSLKGCPPRIFWSRIYRDEPHRNTEEKANNFKIGISKAE